MDESLAPRFTCAGSGVQSKYKPRGLSIYLVYKEIKPEKSKFMLISAHHLVTRRVFTGGSRNRRQWSQC